MRNVNPRLKGELVQIAANQPQYKTVNVIRATHPGYPGRNNTVVMAFEPTEEQRQAIINGEDIYVALLTFGQPQRPILLGVGPEQMGEWFNLEVECK